VLISEIDDPASVSRICVSWVIVIVPATGIIVVAFENNMFSLIDIIII
jgi:hypothetical protein